MLWPHTNPEKMKVSVNDKHVDCILYTYTDGISQAIYRGQNVWREEFLPIPSLSIKRASVFKRMHM